MSYRFAPSPSGALHFGNARVAAFNALAASRENEELLLRIDDTDPTRSSEAAIIAVTEDLRWLGIEFSRRVRQSERAAVAAGLFAELKAANRVYECFETEEELAALRKAAATAGKPPIYPRHALNLSKSEKSRLGAEQPAYWRFKLSDRRLTWRDEIFGEVTTDLASISDPVVVNKRGNALFLLSGIADDLAIGISKIIRGADHLNGSAVQLDICESVGKRPPALAHLPLVSGRDKKPLSKRQGGELSVRSLRERGFEPLALLNFMVFWGANYENNDFCYSFAELASRFRLEKTAKASLTADPQALTRQNRNFVRKMPFAMAKERSHGLDEAVWRAVAPNINDFAQVGQWQRILKKGWRPPRSPQREPRILETACQLLADCENFQQWSGKLAAATNLGGRQLLLPIRLALTGLNEGASMSNIYDILGKEELERRLRAAL